MENSTDRYNCELCHKSFSRKSSRNRHIRELHLQPNLYQCKLCGSRFSKKYNLKAHVENVHSKNFKHLKCSHCTRIFNKTSTLNKHLKIHGKIRETTVASNSSTVFDNESDAQTLADSVLKQLIQLQHDIQPSENLTTTTLESSDMEKSTTKVISIKDNLYPLGHFTLVKSQTVERMDGIIYYKCEFCSKEFRKTYNYLRHRRIHTKVRPFVCILCKKAFATTTRLKAHCSIHKLDEKFGLFHKLYTCPKCKEAFSSIVQLDKHLSSMSSRCKVTLKCPHCLKCYKCLNTFLRHNHFKKDNELEMLKAILPSPSALELKLSNPNNFECNICGIQVNDKTLINQHVKRHENLYKNQCRKCQCSFVTQSALKVHTKVHEATTKYFKCRYCNKCFKNAQSCRRHMLSHLKQLLNTQEELQNENNSFVLHPTFVENGENGEIENTTSIIQSSKNYKTKHEITSTANKDLQHKCSKCDKSFKYKAWLRKHFKYKHSAELIHECNKCFKKFSTKQVLQCHHLVHSTERTKLTCQVCGRKYASNKSLKIHLRIHTQEKPFNCDKCYKFFRTSGHLIQHCKSNHKE